jgi:competence protein ComEA
MKRTASLVTLLGPLAFGLLWTEHPAFAQHPAAPERPPAPRPAVERSPVPRGAAERAPAAAVPPGRASTASGTKVNINTADTKQLMTLEGVTRKLAEKIVDHRKTHGPFTRPDQLRKVEGIGPALWERNRERVVVK